VIASLEDQAKKSLTVKVSNLANDLINQKATCLATRFRQYVQTKLPHARNGTGPDDDNDWKDGKRDLTGDQARTFLQWAIDKHVLLDKEFRFALDAGYEIPSATKEQPRKLPEGKTLYILFAFL
jgi:hypothetical protein